MSSIRTSEGGSPVSGEIDLRKLLKVLWDGRYVVIASTLLAGIVAVAYSLWTAPLYRAEAVVTEAGDNGMNAGNGIASQLGGLASLAGVNVNVSENSREAAAVLESRALVDEFIRRNDLANEILSRERAKASIWRAVEKFRSDIAAIKKDTRKGTTTITVTWKDPIVAAKWANELVTLANAIMRERTLSETSKNLKYLNDQIAQTNVVEIKTSLYGLIESETKKAMLASGRDDFAFRIVDPAVAPEIRFSPRRTIISILGAIVGCGFGIAVVLTRRAFF